MTELSALSTTRLSPRSWAFFVFFRLFLEPRTETLVALSTMLPLPTTAAAPPPFWSLMAVRMASDRALGSEMPSFVLMPVASKSLMELVTTLPAPTITVPLAFFVLFAEPRMLSAIPAVLWSSLVRLSTLFREPTTAAPKFCTP